MQIEEHRHQPRRIIQLPIKVGGTDAGGKAWQTMSSTVDVSPGGTGLLLLDNQTFKGNVLHVSLPLPKNWRNHDLMEPSYRVFALVRYVTKHKRVGVKFLGRHPPQGFLQKPGGVYLLPEDPKPFQVRRLTPRYDLMATVVIYRDDPWTGAVQTETTITDNLSRGGALVRTTLPIMKGERIEISTPEADLHTAAEVVGLRIGKDNIPRLGLRFLDEDAGQQVAHVFKRNGVTEKPGPDVR